MQVVCIRIQTLISDLAAPVPSSVPLMASALLNTDVAKMTGIIGELGTVLERTVPDEATGYSMAGFWSGMANFCAYLNVIKAFGSGWVVPTALSNSGAADPGGCSIQK